VIFTGRADMAHDSADRRGAQIINPFGRGMAASYSMYGARTFVQRSEHLGEPL
jgi:hypothetical protein